MLIHFLSLLGLLYGVSCTEDACLYKAETDCHFHTIIPSKFPGNEEELDDACSNFNGTKECINESVSTCTPGDVAHIVEDDRLRRNLKDAEKLLNVITEICGKDRLLNFEFTHDVGCYQDVFNTNNKEQNCTGYTNNALNYIRRRLNIMLQGRDDERHTFYECLHVIFDMNCILEMIVESRMCSFMAKETAIKVIKIGGNLEDQCPDSIRPDILELLDTLKLVTRKDMYIRNLLEDEPFFSLE